MSLATATVAATDWIAARLAAAPGLAAVPVYVAVALEETPRPRRGHAGPYLTLRHLGSADQRAIGGRLIGTTADIEVTAWDEGTEVSRLAPIVEAVHAAIDRQRGAAGGLEITSCARVAPVERQIEEDRELFTQIGGEYRLRIHQP